VFFLRKGDKLAKNIGVKGENVDIWVKRQFVELRTKKRVVKIFAWKIGNFSGKSEHFLAGFENVSDRIHDPQTSNQIDAVDST